MKNSILKKLSFAFAGAALSLAVSFPAMAAVPSGTLEGADNASVYGWVWDSDSYGHVIPVEISIFSAGSSQILKSDTIKAITIRRSSRKPSGTDTTVSATKWTGTSLTGMSCGLRPAPSRTRTEFVWESLHTIRFRVRSP